MIDKIALIAGAVLPLWNIPLIVRIIKRKSSSDISICWAVGVWICFALMAPAAFVSEDLTWRVFNIVNMIFFSFVLLVVLVYRKRKV